MAAGIAVVFPDLDAVGVPSGQERQGIPLVTDGRYARITQDASFLQAFAQMDNEGISRMGWCGKGK